MMANRIYIIVIAVLAVSALGFLGYEDYRLSKNNKTLEGNLFAARSDLASTSENLDRTRHERNDYKEAFENEKGRVDFLAAQVGGITDTIGLLEKIKRVDPELLQKYSKVYFLNENYKPAEIYKIEPKYTLNGAKDYYFHAKIMPFLARLMDDAITAGIDIKILSGYRSFDEQSGLKTTYKVTYGSGANQFSADQGYSEHQLGSTVDFNTAKAGQTLAGFEKTPAYAWLEANAYKYGFIMSYPKNNSYYIYEPWHWRFVGRELAQKLHEEGKTFYDLDQREIDQYRANFFD